MSSTESEQLDRLEAEFKVAKEAGDTAAMDRIRREYREILPMDAGAEQMLEDCIAQYFGFTSAAAVDRLHGMRAVEVPGSNRVH